MRLRRRAPFAELVERQLDLFLADEARLLADCDAALRAYDDAPGDEAESRYGDWVDLAETVRDELEAVREAYARTLAAGTADAYRDAFNAAARRRFPRETLELD